jgi:Uri superfamily endonuclease
LAETIGPLKNQDGAALRARPGTYVLWLQLGTSLRVRAGGLGLLHFSAGSYAYVGSAFGPGGIAARLGRHFRLNKRQRWHIDYLRRVSDTPGAWVSYDDTRHEHRWALALTALPGAQLPVAGFGSSDCRCPSHLIWFERPPSPEVFRSVCGSDSPRIEVINRICE